MRISKIATATAALLCSGFINAQNYTGPWYNAAESGWGLNIVHQGNVLFPTWFTYDVDGKPLWLTVSGAPKQTDGSFVGDIYRVSGVPFNQINGVAARQTTKLGSARLVFANNGALNFSYTLNNQATQSKSMTRLALGSGTPECELTTASRASATNFSDIWWNPNESGWGINIFHQDNIMFATWFTYDSSGRDTWYVVSRAERQSDGSYSGAIAQVTSGTPYNQINGMPAVANGAASNVGTMVFRFSNGERGQMTYTIGNVTQTKSIERQQFGSPAQVCRNGSSTPVGGGGSSNSCAFILQAGQTRRVRQTGTSSAGEYLERGMGTGSFDGQTVQMWDSFDAQNRRTNRQYARFNSDGSYQNIALETFDPATGTLQTRGRYSENKFPAGFAVGSTFSYSYSLTQEMISPPAPQMVINYSQTFARLANESVTVPAGTFPSACKMDTTTDASTTTQGFSVNTRTIGPVWIDGTVGSLKVNLSSSISAGGFPTGAPATQSTELLEFRAN